MREKSQVKDALAQAQKVSNVLDTKADTLLGTVMGWRYTWLALVGLFAAGYGACLLIH